MEYRTLKVEELEQGTIIRVTLYRPKTLNAINITLLQDLHHLFSQLNHHPTARVAILQGHGRLFTSGLDLKEMTEIFSLSGGEDASRTAIHIEQKIRQMQQLLVSIYECRLPVLVGMHKLCIGAGMDLVGGTDIRYCTKDCVFAIKEIDLGLATDLGALQFYPKFTASSSAFNQFAYTGNNFGAKEALQFGFVSKVFQSQEDMSQGLVETARGIASKSPVGIYTVKKIVKEGEKDLHEGLGFMRTINSVMLQTKDTVEAFSAYIDKRKPVFPKL